MVSGDMSPYKTYLTIPFIMSFPCPFKGFPIVSFLNILQQNLKKIITQSVANIWFKSDSIQSIWMCIVVAKGLN